jgi:hypothetical protein
VQTWTAPAGAVNVKFDVIGGMGGFSHNGVGGSGGEAVATIAVTPGTVYKLTVGGAGKNAPDGSGGFNGGGMGGRTASGTSIGGGGGGASDVRDSNGRILLVAGGGGGGGGGIIGVAAGGAGGGGAGGGVVDTAGNAGGGLGANGSATGMFGSGGRSGMILPETLGSPAVAPMPGTNGQSGSAQGGAGGSGGLHDGPSPSAFGNDGSGGGGGGGGGGFAGGGGGGGGAGGADSPSGDIPPGHGGGGGGGGSYGPAGATLVQGGGGQTGNGRIVLTYAPTGLAGARVHAAGAAELYLIDDNGTRLYIPDLATYTNLFRDGNGVQVVDIRLIPSGPDLTSGAYLGTPPGGGPVYLVSNAQKRWVTSPAVMDKFYFNWGQVRSVPQSTLDALPNGPNLT